MKRLHALYIYSGLSMDGLIAVEQVSAQVVA